MTAEKFNAAKRPEQFVEFLQKVDYFFGDKITKLLAVSTWCPTGLNHFKFYTLQDSESFPYVFTPGAKYIMYLQLIPQGTNIKHQVTTRFRAFFTI